MFYELEHVGTADYFKREDGENFSYPPHLHRNFELILITEGEMSITADGACYTLKRGQAALIFPNQIHSLQSTESRHTLFIFPPRIIQAFYTETGGKLPRNNTVDLPEHLLPALLSLNEKSSRYELKGALYTLCAFFEKTADFYEVESDRQDLLFRILSYAEHNFCKNCSLNELSAAMGYNPEYISRFFRKKMGIPYNKYINVRRLNYAVYLLTNTQNTCLHCALESGYASLRSFNRNFKEQFGIAPQEYRKHSRNSAVMKERGNDR